MYLPIFAIFLAASINLVNADFFIANTTTCYGEFFVGGCSSNVQIITNGVDYNETFTCDKLYTAQHTSYVKKNSAGPTASDFTSTGNICNAGRLYFERNYTTSSVNGTFDIYKGSDSTGDIIGQCAYYEAVMDETKLRCSQLMGTIFYETMYRCNTTEEICGSKSTSTASSSVSSTSTSSSSSSTATSTSSATTTTTTTDTSSTASSTSATSSGSTISESTSTYATATSTSDTSTTSSTESATAASKAKRTAFARRWSG